MSKSNKKDRDRLRDACRQDDIRSNRHEIRRLLKENRWDEIESIEEDLTLKEKEDN